MLREDPTMLSDRQAALAVISAAALIAALGAVLALGEAPRAPAGLDMTIAPQEVAHDARAR
jgi:hypothetical protein